MYHFVNEIKYALDRIFFWEEYDHIDAQTISALLLSDSGCLGNTAMKFIKVLTAHFLNYYSLELFIHITAVHPQVLMIPI